MQVVEADDSVGSEGDIDGAKRRDACPGGPAPEIPPGSKSRGACGEGSRGTWEIPIAPSRTEPRIASASEQERGNGKSERAEGAMKRGNQSKGPRRAKGAPEHGTVKGKDGRDIVLSTHLNAT